jgi:hypothetical protein
VIAANHPLLDVFWTMFIFAWVIWFWLLITVCREEQRWKRAAQWATYSSASRSR